LRHALVTGGNGFIGQHLVAALIRRGDTVRIFDHVPPRKPHRRVEFVQGSVLDPAAVLRAMRGIDHVYHLAGIAHLWTPHERDFEEVNAGGTEIVMAAARQAGVRRVLHCSSETVLLAGACPAGVIDETVAAAPEDAPGPYTRSKLLAERAAFDAAERGLNVVIVNPTVPVGPNDFDLTPPAAMLAHFLGQDLHVYLNGIFNLVDVRDVAAGMVLALERGRPGERYILGGENMSLSQLLGSLDDLSGRRRMKVSIPGSVALCAATVCEWVASRVSHRRPVATAEGVRLALRSAPLDVSKARRELGYAPRPVKKALADFVAWFTAQDEDMTPALAKPVRARTATR
jgi:dihydroflavonol-4-reductase